MEENIGQPSPDASGKLTKSNKSRVWLQIVVGLVFILLLFTSGFFGFKYFQLKKDTVKTEAKEESILDYEEIPEAVKKEIGKVLSGQIDFKDKINNIPYYSSEFNLSESGESLLWLSFGVFEYTPGAKYESGYEGISWTVNLDDQIAELDKLKIGKQFISLAEESETAYPALVEVKYKRLGNNNWEIYDTYFQPSRSFHRHYSSFNPKTNLLINISLGMQNLNAMPERTNECYEIDNGVYDKCLFTYSYPEELQKVVDDLEYELLEIKR